MAGRKIFVGSLPNGIQEDMIRLEFSKYGKIEDVFIKPNCEAGRQWAFITFQTTEQAQQAKELTDRILHFVGADRPCDVMLAKNQGMFGQGSLHGSSAPPPQAAGGYGASYGAAPNSYTLIPPRASPYSQEAQRASSANGPEGPKKIFVGSLPNDIQDGQLREEFSKYGTIMDIFIKQGCESGRQWAFVTYGSAHEAQLAKGSTDRTLMFPGSERACEVTLARNQGQFGQDPIGQAAHHGQAALPAPKPWPQAQVMPAPQQHHGGPRKVFVGSLPDFITDDILRAEFGRFGVIVDVFLKTGCEPGRQWAFVTYAHSEQATMAKESADRVLIIPGAERPCEVMMAKNQGKFGQESIHDGGGGGGYGDSYGNGAHMGGAHAQPLQLAHWEAALPFPQAQPPPPCTPPPAHLTSWRQYKTAAGIPYYHNEASGVTQWECPPELQVPAEALGAAAGFGGMGGQRYAPY